MDMPIRFKLIFVLTILSGAWCCGVGAGGAVALPPGRHYEMVSPVFKGGFGATLIAAVAPDGKSIGYFSSGVFGGAPSGGGQHANYFARRGGSEWETAPLGAPASFIDGPVVDLSPDMTVEFAAGSPGPNIGHESSDEVGFWLHPTVLPDTDDGWNSVGQLEVAGQEIGLSYITADSEFCHVLFAAATLLPEAGGTTGQLYEYDRGCGGQPASVTLVAVDNQNNGHGKIINRECEVDTGIKHYRAGGENLFNAISADGSEVFFTDCLSGTTNPASPHQLFVRLGEMRTLEVSRPLGAGAFGGCVGEVGGTPGEVPCAGAATRPSADFAGASEDGSKVYFTTTAQLVAGDKDTGEDLYMATIGCPGDGSQCDSSEREVTSLSQVSHNPNGGVAGVQGVVRVAPDGQRVYFVASGDLLSSTQQKALESQGRPLPQVGAANLYVYDSATGGTISFVADLCTGTERSETTEDFRCPSDNVDTALWTSAGESAGESQTAGPSGEFLVFATYAQLTSNDTNMAKDVYRYDAETGAISRVSIGEDGYDPNGGGGLLGSRIAQGHSGGYVLEQHEMNNRAISEDGSRIVFTSREPLSSSDTNGLVNAYEWHAGPGSDEGSVALVSTGSDQEPVEDVVISPNGLSVFFDTVQGLVPQDKDGAPDVYDARLGENFPTPPLEPEPCEGDGCQGPLTNPAPLLVPGSVSQAPGGNLPAPVVTTAKPLSKTSPKCKRGFTRDKKGKCTKVKRKARKAAVSRRSSHKSNGGGRS